MAKHFIPLWGQQRDGAGAANRNRGNISYSYGDSNQSVLVVFHASPETFHTPMGTATCGLRCAVVFPCAKHFIPLRGQQQPSWQIALSTPWKHFIPLRGQQPSTPVPAAPRHRTKHFIPLRGQQLSRRVPLPPPCRGNISYPYGDSNPLIW